MNLKKIKEIRLKLGLSRERLAEMSGITRVHIWNIENGKTTNLTLDTIKRLADALQIEMIDIIQ
jgi:transcriptional regulator with XRE-family HTH domain